MERELWPLLYRLLQSVAKDFQQKNVTCQPWILVAVLLWAALQDRPLSWACQPQHWSTTRLRPVQLPSPATRSRRLCTVGTGLFLRALEQRLRDSGGAAWGAFELRKAVMAAPSAAAPGSELFYLNLTPDPFSRQVLRLVGRVLAR